MSSPDLKAPLMQKDHVAQNAQKRLQVAVVLVAFFMVAEIIGGILANSLAIITDAAHMMSDMGGFLVSMFSIALVSKKATEQYSFGFHQAEVIGALISVLMVWLLTGMLLFAAMGRLKDLEPINGKLMTFLACLGLVVNLILMKTLGHSHAHGGGGCGHNHGNHSHDHGNHVHDHGNHVHDHGNHVHDHGNHVHDHGNHVHDHGNHSHDHENHSHDYVHHGHSHGSHDHSHSHGTHSHGEHSPGRASTDKIKEDESQYVEDEGESLAMQAAIAHVIGDIVQSVGVIVASVLIWWQPFDLGVTERGVSKWNYADPMCTLLFAVLVIFTTKDTMVGIVRSLMFCSPERLNAGVVEKQLLRVSNVVGCHDIHIWEVGRNPVFTAHIIVDKQENSMEALHACIECMNKEFGVDHCTIQVEIYGEFDHAKESYGRLHDHSNCCP